MLPLLYGLLGGGNALSYLWEPGLALLACCTVPPSLVLRYLMTSKSIFYESRFSCSSYTACQHGEFQRLVTKQVQRSVPGALSSATFENNISFPRLRYYPIISGSPTGSPGNLAVANEPCLALSPLILCIIIIRQFSLSSHLDLLVIYTPRGQGGTSEDWKQFLLPPTPSFDAVTRKLLSFNGCRSSTTTTDEEDHDEEDRLAS
ncbi:hypothetical protein DL96DRAFT_1639270 [Flagelloscypha sp. PMI_526]|nr:hypothetical protein DL96DRAFT_1639270 [Flagelloscypha sp. PMI_526]